MLNFRTLRFFMGLIAITTMLFSAPEVMALEVPSNVVASKDKSQLTTVIKNVIDFILYSAMAIGVASLAWSVLKASPILGKATKEEAKQDALVSIGVIFAAGLFEMLATWLFSLFG